MQRQLSPPRTNRHCHAEHNLGAESLALPEAERKRADVTSFCSAWGNHQGIRAVAGTCMHGGRSCTDLQLISKAMPITFAAGGCMCECITLVHAGQPLLVDSHSLVSTSMHPPETQSMHIYVGCFSIHLIPAISKALWLSIQFPAPLFLPLPLHHTFIPLYTRKGMPALVGAEVAECAFWISLLKTSQVAILSPIP